MLDLQTLTFKVETTALDVAIKKVETLAQSMGDLSAVARGLENATRAETKATQEANAERKRAEKAAAELATTQKKAAQEAIKAAKEAESAVVKANKAAEAAALKSQKEQEKAAKAQVAAIEKATKAQELAQQRVQAAQQASVDKVAKLQERLSNTFRDVASGFTKGESSVLNFARSLGLAETQLDPIKTQLQDIGKLMSNPLDSSIGAIRSISKEAEVLANRMDLAAQGVSLTSKQLKEFSRIQTELEGSFKAGGMDIKNDPNAQRLFNEQLYSTKVAYLEVAKANNAKLQSERESNVQLGRSAQMLSAQDKALMKLTRELERSQNAVDGLNSGLQVSNSNRLLNFERMLTTSGVSAEVAAAKLAKYRENLEKVQQAQQAQQRSDEQSKRDFLSRALAPQISDVIVSLQGGMPLMQVLLQQGGQTRDLIQQSGVAAGDLNNVLRQTGQEFVATLAGAASAVGGLLGGAVESATNGMLEFLGGITGVAQGVAGMDEAIKAVNDRLTALGFNTTSISGFFTSLQAITVSLAELAVAGLAISLIAVSTAMYQVSKASSVMSDALITNGAASGLSKKAAIDLAIATDVVGSSLVDVIEVFGKLAKAGSIPQASFAEVTKAVLTLSNTLGVSVDDLIAQYKKLTQDPVKELEKLALATGTVSVVEIERVENLIKTGKETLALTEATKIFTKSLNEMAREAELSAGGLSKVWALLKTSFNETWEQVQVLAATDNIGTNLIKTVLMGFVAILPLVNMLLLQAGFLTIGFATALSRLASFDLVGAKDAIVDMGAAIRGVSGDYQQTIDYLFNLGRYSEDEKNKELERIAQLKKARFDEAQARMDLEKEVARVKAIYGETVSNDRVNAVISGDRETLRALNLTGDLVEKEKLRLSVIKETQVNLGKSSGINQAYSESLKRINDGITSGALKANEAEAALKALNAAQSKGSSAKTEATKIETFYQKTIKQFTEMAVKNQSVVEGLTKAETAYNVARADKNYEKLSTQEKAEIERRYVLAEATELAKDAEEKRLKLLKEIQANEQKATGFDANYADNIKAADELLESGKITFEIFDRYIKGLVAVQPIVKDLRKQEEDRQKASEKMLGDLKEQLAAEDGITASMSVQLGLLGKSEEEQKRTLGMLKIRLDYEEEIAKIQREALEKKLDPTEVIKSEQAALDLRTKRELNLNTEIANDAAKKQFEEFEKIKDDIAGVIVTAITDGGKAAASKLKDILQSALNKRLTVYVDALVDTALGGSSGGSVGSSDNAFDKSFTNGITKAFETFAKSSTGQKFGLSSTTNEVFPGQGASLTSNGQMLSKGLSIVGDTLAGYAMGSMARTMISNGYSAGKGFDNFQKVGIAVGSAIGGPIVGAIIGAGAGVFNQLFGRKLKDSGIEGTFGGQSGFEGNSFEFLKGGFLRSNKTNTSALDPQVQQYFQDSFNALRVEVGTFAESLGLETDKIVDFSSKIKLSLKDLSPEEADKRIKEAFGKVSDELAAIILDTTRTVTVQEEVQVERFTGYGGDSDMWSSQMVTEIQTVTKVVGGAGDAFAKTGETASQTLSRLANSLLAVNSVIDTLGGNILTASLSSADLASKLVDAFGGMDQFAAATSSYYDNFYSEQERTDTGVRQLTEAFSKLGLVMPDVAAKDAVQQFRDLVNAQYALGESGIETLAALLKLNPQFKNLVDSTISLKEAAGEAAIDLAKVPNLLKEALKSLTDNQFDIENDILTAQSEVDKVRARIRTRDLENLTKGLDDESALKVIAQYDYNESLKDTLEATTNQIEANEKLKTSLSSYTDRVSTDAEKLAVKTNRVAAAFAKYDTAVPTDVSGFTKLVQGNTGAVLEDLMAISDDFLDVMDAGKTATEKLKTTAEELVTAAGISANTISDEFLKVILGKSSATEAGAAISKMVTDGIYNSLASGFTQQITGIMMTQLITPMIQAAVAGTSISAAVSQQSIDAMLGAAKNAAAVLGTLFADEGFKNLMAGISTVVGEVTASLVTPLGSLTPVIDDLAPAADTAAASVSSLGEALGRFGDTLNTRVDLLKIDDRQGINPVSLMLPTSTTATGLTIAVSQMMSDSIGSVIDAVEIGLNANRTLYQTKIDEIQNSIDQGLSGALLDAAQQDIREIETLRDSVLSYLSRRLLNVGDDFVAFFKRLGTFGSELETTLAAANNSAVGQALNLSAIGDYFTGIGTEIGKIQAALARGAAIVGGGPLVSAVTSGFADAIGGAATQIGTAINASIIANLPDAVRNDPALAGLSTSMMAVVGSVTRGSVQGLNDSFLLLSGALVRGDITATQFDAAMNHVITSFSTGTDELDAASETIEEAYNRLRNVVKSNEDIARERINLEDQLRTLTSTSAELRAYELSKIDPSNRALQLRIWLIEDETKAVDDAMSALERAVEAQKKDIDTQLQAANDLASEVSSIFDMLKDAVDDLYGSVDSTARQSAAAARRFITQALAGAVATGSLPDSKELSEAISNAKGDLDRVIYANKFESDKDRLLLANELRELQDISKIQLTDAERQIKLAEEQLLALDKVLERAREQIDVMRGVDRSVISVEAAVVALGVAIANQTAAAAVKLPPVVGLPPVVRPPAPVITQPTFTGVTSNPTTVAGAAEMLYRSVQGASATTAQMDAALALLAPTGFQNSLSEILALKDTYSFAVGTNYVPYDMTANIHKGEMIVPAKFNPATSGLVNDNSDLVEQIELMRYELRANVTHTSKLAKQLERLTVPTNDGEALQTKNVV